MAAEFVTLADLLRAPAARGGPVDTSMDAVMPMNAAAPMTFGDERADVVEAVRDARLFRARLADAFDAAAARLLRDLASDVLARELLLAPCDLTELVRRAAERAPVVCVRVAACDVACVAGALRSRGADVPVAEDSTLAAGDVVVELAGGALDARLGVRLATVLEAFA